MGTPIRKSLFKKQTGWSLIWKMEERKNGVFNPKKIYINVVIKRRKNHDGKPLLYSQSESNGKQMNKVRQTEE